MQASARQKEANGNLAVPLSTPTDVSLKGSVIVIRAVGPDGDKELI